MGQSRWAPALTFAIWLMVVAAACGSENDASEPGSNQPKQVDKASEGRTLAADACAEAALSYLSAKQVFDSIEYGTQVSDYEALFSAASEHLGTARTKAADAGQLDEHWLELAHLMTAVSFTAPTGRQSYFDVDEWCRAESLAQ